MKIVYERAGVYIEYNDTGAIFKKNGLTIEIPAWMLIEFEQEFEQAKADYIKMKTMGADNEISE